ncbi:hypothetical protein ACFXPN_29560 [Streptomyces griseorubiginosus]|uniref:hypothetical protein n=1 Tax=Streptomyces griseorubiginosus TaxID=67304 RepID=UPI003697267F
MSEDVRAAYANYGVTFPLDETSAPEAPEVTALSEAVQASPGVSPARAAAALLDAELVRLAETGDEVTGKGLAAVEETAGLLFDPQVAEGIAAAARAQGRLEVRAEYAQDLAERGRQIAMLSDQNRTLREGQTDRDGLKASLDAVHRLLEGRPLTDYLPVQAILDAVAHGTTPYDSAPMTLAWEPQRGVELPDDGSLTGQAIVPCTSVYGGRADLVLDGEHRQALASLLGLQLRDVNAPCPTPNCGADDDLDATNPFLFGWSRLEIAALGDGPRWYCSDMCVIDALTRAGHELREEADRQAEQGGDL